MATMLLKVEGLGDGDEERFKDALRDLPGVFGVVVSPTEGCAEVDFEDDEVDYTRIIERAKEAGFRVRLSG